MTEVSHKEKRKYVEEGSVKEYFVNLAARSSCDKERDKGETDEDSGEEYDSDDQVMYADGRRMCIRLRNEYYRQVEESEGFDITLDLDLGCPIGAPIIPQRNKQNMPRFVDLSCLAISDFNSKNATNYEWVRNISVNTSHAAGMWCYITFEGKDATTNDSKIFQANAWWGIDGDKKVTLCRFKKPQGDQGDKKETS